MENQVPPVRCYRMSCPHDGYHGIRSAYDRRDGLLRFFWTCERCGARLEEAGRTPYRPRFDPRGNDRFLGARTLTG